MKITLFIILITFLLFGCEQKAETKFMPVIKVSNTDAKNLPSLKSDSIIIANRVLTYYFTDKTDHFNNVSQKQRLTYNISAIEIDISKFDTVVYQVNMPNRPDGNSRLTSNFDSYYSYKQQFENVCIEKVLKTIFELESIENDYCFVSDLDIELGKAIYGKNMEENNLCGVDAIYWINEYISERKKGTFGKASVVFDIYEEAISKFIPGRKEMHEDVLKLIKECA